jgi:hypothetical protein
LGIARGSAALLAQPAGAVRATLPAGTAVTVTGKSADGRFVAVYTNDGQPGWVNVNQLALFGIEALLIVEESTGPGLAATMVADALVPVQVLETLVATLEP